jgi:hypothetical protein
MNAKQKDSITKMALIAVCIIVVASTLIGSATSFDEVNQIKNDVLRKRQLLSVPANCVLTNYTIINIQTNGSGFLEILAKDVYSQGMNGLFAYATNGIIKPVSIFCKDAATNGFQFFNGDNLSYIEYKNGQACGFYVELHTNMQIAGFMNISNGFIVGESYEFDETGKINRTITNSTPNENVIVK